MEFEFNISGITRKALEDNSILLSDEVQMNITNLLDAIRFKIANRYFGRTRDDSMYFLAVSFPLSVVREEAARQVIKYFESNPPEDFVDAFTETSHKDLIFFIRFAAKKPNEIKLHNA